MYMQVYIKECNSLKAETPQMPICSIMDRDSVLCLYNGILYISKSKQTMFMYSNIYESHKHMLNKKSKIKGT